MDVQCWSNRQILMSQVERQIRNRRCNYSPTLKQAEMVWKRRERLDEKSMNLMKGRCKT